MSKKESNREDETIKDVYDYAEIGIKFERMKEASKSKIRKHNWITCLLDKQTDFDSLSDDELEELLKATKWLDRFTDNEYKYLFDRDSLSNIYIVRSRLKKKVKEWLMVLSTLWSFDNELLQSAIIEAKEEYKEQTARPFWFQSLANSKELYFVRMNDQDE